MYVAKLTVVRSNEGNNGTFDGRLPLYTWQFVTIY